MSSLIGAHSLSKSFGTQVLFKNISLTICQGDRIGLIGPNGSGKSTLLKILTGQEPPNDGSISRKQGLRVGYASQMPEFPSLSVEEVLIKELPLYHEVDARTAARKLLGKAQFTDFNQNAQALSGGWKKRLDIIRALISEPDLLLLDEPTNHLDLEGILWLENFLKRERITFVVVSHDRYFLENVTNKIIELNRCYPQGLFACDGNMSTFMELREGFLKAQEQYERGLASVMRNEAEWLRRSPKARTTKSRSRIQRAYELFEEHSEVKERNKVSKVSLNFTASERETRKLLVGKNLTKSLGAKQLFKGLDLTLSPGSRLGIVGKNGTGKTTLLKMLAGMLPQDMGTIKYADDLKLVYFDQHRESIPNDATLREALSPLSDTVNYRGQMIHVNGWAKRFLFSTDRLSLPVKCLSGGERARILIARLMLEPADILFLDEPTNDLDIQTLEVIEDSLQDFAGAVVLISHDRCLMDRICTEILVLEEDNQHRFFSDYNQWENASQENTVKKESSKALIEQPKNVSNNPSKKLSYKEQKELDGMEDSLLALESEINLLQNKLNDPLLAQDTQKSLELYHSLSNVQHNIDNLYLRWQFLLDKREGNC